MRRPRVTADTGRLGLGAFLVALGTVVLAARAELVDPALIPPLADAWPLLLVALGLAVMIRATAPALGAVVFGAALGVGGGLLLAGGVPAVGCGTPANVQLRPVAAGTFAGPASVALELPCGELEVEAAAGAQWAVTAAGDEPDVTSGDDELEVDGRGMPFAQGSQRWHVRLPVAPRLDVATTVNAGRAVLALDGARLERLSVTVNAGELVAALDGASVEQISATVNAGTVRIALPGETDVTGSLTANAGSLELCVPEGSGLRIRSESTLSGSNLEDAGLTEVDEGAWQNGTFETAANRIDLTTSTSLGSLTLDPDGGCEP